MIGLMYKDLYDNFRVWKNLASYIFGAGVLILVALFVRTEFNFLWVTVILASLFSSCLIESSCEQDERANFGRLMTSFPLTVRQIVLARYLLAACFIAVSNLLTILFTLYTVFVQELVSLRKGLFVWAASFAFSIFFTGLVYLVYFLLGKKVGTIVYLIFFVLMALGYSLFVFLAAVFGIPPLEFLSPGVMLAAGFLLAAAFFAASCAVSARICRKKWASL